MVLAHSSFLANMELSYTGSHALISLRVAYYAEMHTSEVRRADPYPVKFFRFQKQSIQTPSTTRLIA